MRRHSLLRYRKIENEPYADKNIISFSFDVTLLEDFTDLITTGSKDRSLVAVRGNKIVNVDKGSFELDGGYSCKMIVVKS